MTVVIESSSSGFVDLAGWITALAVFIGLLWNIYWSRISAKNAHRHEFWFKRVIAPRCIEPIINLYNDYIINLHSRFFQEDSSREMRKFIHEFQNAKNKVIGEVWISNIFDQNYYNLCCRCLDDVEDALAMKFSESQEMSEPLTLAQKSSIKRFSNDKMLLLLRAARNLDPTLEN